ncbi:unnamed protein product [Cuscuta epithymum]|uniref:CCHC-type domain-containing protein n=1 Tax=Cuscuta epithymum TaxID=186058 RepID=A0AAV0ECQ2_9ASTE|nr:unnamed protein product [Cuscuta epithymum]
MAVLWRLGKGVSIEEIGEKRYIFIFFHSVDVNRVLDYGPWLFDKNMIVLRAIKLRDIPLKVLLDTVELWVQAHNVPYSHDNLGTARRIGNYLGEFVRWDDTQFDGKWESYMCVRVRMNVTKPLKVGTILMNGKGEGYWVAFKYEKLPSLCFCCGVIGHVEKYCLLYEKGDQALTRPYSSWL